MTDLMLDTDQDLKIQNGDWDCDGSDMQEVSLILQSVQGEWKQFPLLGPNLYRFIKAKKNAMEVEKAVTLHLAMDDKSYEQIKEKIRISYGY